MITNNQFGTKVITNDTTFLLYFKTTKNSHTHQSLKPLTTIPTTITIQNHEETMSGYWIADEKAKQPYHFSKKVCESSFINRKDCETTYTCPKSLMKFTYIKNNLIYPKFDVNGFRKHMKYTKILFIGSSLTRQQVMALVWSLGHKKIKWKHHFPPKKWRCTANRVCHTDQKGKITICWQFLGSMSMKIYR